MGAGSKPMVHLWISAEEIALLNINEAWDRMKELCVIWGAWPDSRAE